jgi:hypothetical protein
MRYLGHEEYLQICLLMNLDGCEHGQRLFADKDEDQDERNDRQEGAPLYHQGGYAVAEGIPPA